MESGFLGSLGALIETIVWLDESQNSKFDSAESTLTQRRFTAPLETTLYDMLSENGVHATGTSRYLSLVWCSGELSMDTDGSVLCDGSTSALAEHNTARKATHFQQ